MEMTKIRNYQLKSSLFNLPDSQSGSTLSIHGLFLTAQVKGKIAKGGSSKEIFIHIKQRQFVNNT